MRDIGAIAAVGAAQVAVTTASAVVFELALNVKSAVTRSLITWPAVVGCGIQTVLSFAALVFSNVTLLGTGGDRAMLELDLFRDSPVYEFGV